MRRYLFIFIGVFTLFMVACHSNKNLSYQDCAGLDPDICPGNEELDTGVLFGYTVSDTLFMSSDCVDSLSKLNIYIYNNPICDRKLEALMFRFSRMFCGYPENGEDFWRRYYVHDRLNEFKGGYNKYMNSYAKSCEEYPYIGSYRRKSFSLFYDREYIDFYDCDSVVIFSCSNRKVTWYAVKPEYLYDNLSSGKIVFHDLIDVRGLAPNLRNWSLPCFYTSDSIHIRLPEIHVEGFRMWAERYVSLCDSIIAENKLEEKMSLNECLLWYDNKKDVITEFFGKNLPDEIVSNRELKRVIMESFKYANKRARYFRTPFIIRNKRSLRLYEN